MDSPFSDETQGVDVSNQLHRQGAGDVCKLYAEVVTAIMHKSGRFEARFDTHGRCTNGGFLVTLPEYGPRYLVIVGVSVHGRESMKDLLGDPRPVISRALTMAGVEESRAFMLVTNQQATRNNLQPGIRVEVPDEATVRRLYASWCTKPSR